MIQNLFFFFLIYLFSFFSIFAYGKLANKILFSNEEEENPFVYFFFGTGFLIILSFVIYWLGLKTAFVNGLILSIGFLYFLTISKNIKNIKTFITIPVLLFVGLLIYKNHDDFYLYHIQHIVEITGDTTKIGIGNLNPKYVYGSLIVYLESLFYLPFFEFKLVNIPRFLAYVSICGYLYFNTIQDKAGKKFISYIFLLFLLLKFRRFSEHGYDYIATFYILFIFIEYFFNEIKLNNLKKIFYLFSTAFVIKVTSLFFIPFIFYLFFKYVKKQFYWTKFLKDVGPTAIVFCVFIFNSFASSGCLFYPIKQTCLNKQTISWQANYNEILKEKIVAEAWAKGFYHQKKEERIASQEKYVQFLNWFPNWFRIHFIPKIIEPLLIFIFLNLLIYYLGTKENLKSKFTKYKKNIVIAFASFSLWILIMPQLRFGYSSFLILAFLILALFQKKIIEIKYKSILLLLAVLFFNIDNLKRINKNFFNTSNTNFPYYEIINLKVTKNNNGYFNYFTNENGFRVVDEEKQYIKKIRNLPITQKNIKVKKIKYFEIISN